MSFFLVRLILSFVGLEADVRNAEPDTTRPGIFTF